MCQRCRIIGMHNHVDRGSNLKLRDTTNRVEDLIMTAYELGYEGIAITDHESVSAHVKAIKALKDLKTPKDDNPAKITRDFKLILGNEIYLVDSLSEVRDNYQGGGVTKFPHFLILAKDEIGHEQMRMMSSRAWEQSFQTGLMLRTPTTKEYMKEIISSNPGHLIASSACLGSEVCIHLLAVKEALESNNKEGAEKSYQKACDFVQWCIDVFGKEDFYLELQPAYSEEQIFCNKYLLKLAELFKLEYIITTDSHYLRPEDRIVHKAFLNAKEGEREVDAFYEATFVQTIDEIHERLSYLDHEIVKKALDNTIKIGDKIENYTILKPTVIPKIKLPEFQIRGLFKKVYDQYTFIEKMANSEDEQDRYMIKLIEDGFLKYLPYKTFTNEHLHLVTNRINTELGELWDISIKLNEKVPAYYVTVAKIVDIIWDDGCDGGNSFVGISRGSAMGFLICYLMGITQISPLDYGIELPHWRHLTAERPDFPDIDIDSEASKRDTILRALRKYFGNNRVLQVATFGTEASKSAIQTAARGLGIDNDTAMYVSGLVPFERGSSWKLKDCVYGNEKEEREPIQEFIKEINKHENWLNVAMKIEGVINKRSIHASGVIVFNEDYYKTNALMTAPNGTQITQFSLEDCEALSNVKMDLLTIEALDKMRVTVDNLIEYKEMEKQKTLRDTYDKYLSPQIIDIESAEVFEAISSDSVVDLFQFSTEIGIQTVKKVQPTNLIELAAANSLMRLMSDHGDSPIDTFVKHKNNINLWYEEMRGFKLSEDEIKVMEHHLRKFNGVADTQELVMLMSMAEQIAGFGVEDANVLRKSIAKPKQMKKKLEKIKQKFFKQGQELGNSINILNYVWEVQISRQLSYSFSILHTLAYSLIALQEVHLNLKYNPIFWRTACLTVNSGSMQNEIDKDVDNTEEDNYRNQSTDYGKIAAAIGNMQSKGVKIGLPNINTAGFGFTPDVKNEQIIFGLKGINGIGDEIVQQVIQNRPYTSFQDFFDRMHKNPEKEKTIPKGKVIQLIKAGCFEAFGSRIQVMREFIDLTFPPKEKLNLQNFSSIMEHDLLPENYKLHAKIFNFRKYVIKNVHALEGKDKHYALDKISAPFYYEHFLHENILSYHGDYPIISEKLFKKEYDLKMNEIKSWLSSDETLELYNKKLYEKEWNSVASGTVSSWEMDALSFYYTEHELSAIDHKKYHHVKSFFSLPEQPEVVSMMQFKNGERPKFKLNYIVGTVLDKNKNKHTVSLLTPEGVVNVKYYDGAFAHYNKQVSKNKPDGSKEILERSWFTRGNKLIIYGFRREGQFKPYKYRDSPNQHTTMLITDIEENGTLKYVTERKEV